MKITKKEVILILILSSLIIFILKQPIGPKLSPIVDCNDLEEGWVNISCGGDQESIAACEIGEMFQKRNCTSDSGGGGSPLILKELPREVISPTGLSILLQDYTEKRKRCRYSPYCAQNHSLTPINNSQDQELNINLNWEPILPYNETEITKYDIYFNTNSPILISSNQTNTTYNLENLSYDTDYNWKVVSKDSFRELSSGIFKFSTIEEPQINEEDSKESNGGTTNIYNIIEQTEENETEKFALFDIRVEILEDSKEVYPGSDVKAEITLFNFGTLKPVDGFLNCSLEDVEKNKLDILVETLAIEMQTAIIRDLTLPEEITEGNYFYNCYLRYENETVVGSDIFKIKPKRETKSEFNIKSITIFISLILAIIILVVLLLLSRKKKKKRKRKTKKRHKSKTS